MKTDNVLLNSEQSVIGSILIDNGSFDEIDLLPNEFLVESHRIIFNEISSILGEGKAVDLIILAESLDAKKQLENVGELKYIGEIVQNCGTSANIKYHAGVVRKAHKLRKAKSLIVDLNEAIDSKESVDMLTEIAEAGLFDLSDNESKNDIASIAEAVAEAIDFEDHDKNGIKTGLRDLDRLLDGFKKGDLIIVAGRPSMGKSSLTCQIAEHVSNRESVVIFSLEMPKRQVASRMLRYHETKLPRVEAIRHFYELNLHIDDRPTATLQHIRSQCRRIKRQHGLSMIIVDYLQLMKGQGDNRNQEIGSLSRGLKGLAKEFDMPVVVLSQLSRKVEERNDKRPVMSDLRESGEIEQDADVILFIYREEVYNQNTPDKGIAEIICRKNRNGSIGSIDTVFDGNITRFSDFNGEHQHVDYIPPKRGFTVV